MDVFIHMRSFLHALLAISAKYEAAPDSCRSLTSIVTSHSTNQYEALCGLTHLGAGPLNFRFYTIYGREVRLGRDTCPISDPKCSHCFDPAQGGYRSWYNVSDIRSDVQKFHLYNQSTDLV